MCSFCCVVEPPGLEGIRRLLWIGLDMPVPRDVLTHYLTLLRQRSHDQDAGVEGSAWTQAKHQLTLALGGDAPPNDQRRSVRVRTVLPVSHGHEGRSRENLITNISQHGVFIATGFPLEVGDRITLRLQDQHRLYSLEVIGTVVSQLAGKQLTLRERGMGIQLDGLLPASQEKINDLYIQILAHEFDKANQYVT